MKPTERQIEVLLALVEYGTEKAAAAALFLSVHTIRNHAHKLYNAIGARTRSEAVVMLWPRLRDRYRLPGDAPLERRHAA